MAELRAQLFAEVEETAQEQAGETCTAAAATLLLSMGILMKTVQAILGHASYTITANIYGRVTRDMHEEAANVMERFLRRDV